MVNEPGRILLTTNFTASNLATQLAKITSLEVIRAPYDQVEATLLSQDQSGWQQNPHWLFVWTLPHKQIAGFTRRIENEPVTGKAILNEVDVFANQLDAASEKVRGIFVASWTRSTLSRGLGLMDLEVEEGIGYTLIRMNIRLAERIAEMPRVHLLDAQQWISRVGEGAYSPKLWYLNKTPFSLPVFQIAAAEIQSSIDAIESKNRKLIILDLDNTLWG